MSPEIKSMAAHTYAGDFKSAIARAKRVLVKGGFPWSVTTGRYMPFGDGQRTTRGVRVMRVGCSETIALHIFDSDNSQDRKDRHLIFALAVATLRDAGLAFDDRGWLACGADAERARR